MMTFKSMMSYIISFLKSFMITLINGIKNLPQTFMDIKKAFSISIKAGTRECLNNYINFSRFKNDYKIKLISRLSLVFICMLGTLVYIIKMSHGITLSR